MAPRFGIQSAIFRQIRGAARRLPSSSKRRSRTPLSGVHAADCRIDAGASLGSLIEESGGQKIRRVARAYYASHVSRSCVRPTQPTTRGPGETTSASPPIPRYTLCGNRHFSGPNLLLFSPTVFYCFYTGAALGVGFRGGYHSGC